MKIQWDDDSVTAPCKGFTITTDDGTRHTGVKKQTQSMYQGINSPIFLGSAWYEIDGKRFDKWTEVLQHVESSEMKAR